LSIILLVLEEAKGSLRFLVHPDWRTFVQSEDVTYMESILNDFLERAELHPDALFKQLSSLGSGPLMTEETGKSISDHPDLLERCSCFVQL
jgi:hypothetical protein